MSTSHGEGIEMATANIENKFLHLDSSRPNSRGGSPASEARHRHIHHDNESITTHNLDNDPYALSRALKSPSELSLIKRTTSTNSSNTAKKRHQKKASAKEVKKFYQNQNDKIQKLLKSVEEHRSSAKETQGDTAVKYKIAVTGSFVANVALSGLQLFAAIKSGSLSLFTTMADALFDPLSNVTLILAHRAINRVDSKKFPSGKARLETVGNIIFASIMCSVSLILITFSIRDLATQTRDSDTKRFHLESVIAVTCAFFVKLSLFFYCYAIRNLYSDVQILWQDHRNDLFINGFGILTSVGGSKLRWWIDPLGSLLLSILILCLWSKTAWGEYMLLVGQAANPEMQQLVTYISMTHSSDILQLDTVRAYHSGPRLIIEVDVVMDPEASLRHTHDVAEELQMKLESLPDVERAYVHIDYETGHKPEHFVKKEL